jgi:sulfur-carrier protein adenylyltransferase/sulfurtransferase
MADDDLPAIAEIAPRDAHARLARGAVLVDVREAGEHATGVPDGALAVPRAALEADPARWLPDRDAEVLLVCAGGLRSRAATCG